MRTDFRRKFDSERFNAPFSFVQKGIGVSESRQNSSGHDERRQSTAYLALLGCTVWLPHGTPSSALRHSPQQSCYQSLGTGKLALRWS